MYDLENYTFLQSLFFVPDQNRPKSHQLSVVEMEWKTSDDKVQITVTLHSTYLYVLVQLSDGLFVCSLAHILTFISLHVLHTDLRERFRSFCKVGGKTQVEFCLVGAVHCSGFTQSFADHSRGPDYLE